MFVALPLLLLIGQDAARPQPVVSATEGAVEHFDLAKFRPAATKGDCNLATATSDEILVCARVRKDVERIDPERFREKPVDLGFRLFGADARPQAFQRNLPNGASAPAVGVNFKWKF